MSLCFFTCSHSISFTLIYSFSPISSADPSPTTAGSASSTLKRGMVQLYVLLVFTYRASLIFRSTVDEDSAIDSAASTPTKRPRLDEPGVMKCVFFFIII